MASEERGEEASALVFDGGGEVLEEEDDWIEVSRGAVLAATVVDRFGEITVETFETIEAARSGFCWASPLYARVLYEKAAGEWTVIRTYGCGTDALVLHAPRLIALCEAHNHVSVKDLSQGHLGRWSCARAYRCVTLPPRVCGSACKAALRHRFGPKRPTWNAAFETAVTTLRSAAQNSPRTIAALRVFTNVSIPGALLPSGALRFVDRGTPPMEWIWPRHLTPTLSASVMSTSSKVATFPEALLLRDDVPLVLYVHGGAFALCGRGTHRELAFRLALESCCLVVMVEYRRPPDVSFEETLSDVRAAYERLVLRRRLADPSSEPRVVVAGDSAGGGLCLSLCLHLRDDPKPGIPQACAAVLLSPWVDLTNNNNALDSKSSNAAFDFLPADLIELFAESVDSAAAASPLRQDLHGLPPLLIHAGQCEVLHDQIVALARKASNEGNQVTLNVWRDMVHVSPIFAAVHSTPRAQLAQVGAFIRAQGCHCNSKRRLLIEVYEAQDLTFEQASMWGDGQVSLALRLASDWQVLPQTAKQPIDKEARRLEWPANASLVLEAATAPLELELRSSRGAVLGRATLDYEEQQGVLRLPLEPTGWLSVAVSVFDDGTYLVPGRITVRPPPADDPTPPHRAPVHQLACRCHFKKQENGPSSCSSSSYSPPLPVPPPSPPTLSSSL